MSICHLRRELDGRDHAARIGLALACDRERSAVIRRRAHDRQAQRDIHAVPEGKRFDRDERLIVVHAQRRIVA